MNKMKNHRLFKIICLVLAATFICLDISYAYPPENSTLAAPSALQQQPINEYAARFQQSIFSNSVLLASILVIGEHFFGKPEKDTKPLPSKYAEKYAEETAIDTELGKLLTKSGITILKIVPVERIKKETDPDEIKNALDAIGFKGILPDEGVVFILYRKNGKKFLVQVAEKSKVSPANLPGYECPVSDKYVVKYVPEDYEGKLQSSLRATEGSEAIPFLDAAKEEPKQKEGETKPREAKGKDQQSPDKGTVPPLLSVNPFALIFSGAAVVALAIGAGLYLAIWRKFFPISWHLFWMKSGLDAEDAHKNALGEIGAPAVPSLIKLLRDSGEDVRVAAAKALGEIKDPRASELLLKILSDNYDLLFAAVKVLVKIGPPAVPALIETLGDNYTENAHSAAAGALGEIKDLRAVDPLIKLLGGNNLHVRNVAAKALGEIKDFRAVEPLIKLLGNSNDDVRYLAVETLVKIGPPAVPSLIKLLNNRDQHVSYAAEKALEDIKNSNIARDKEAAKRPNVPALIKLLSDSGEDVRIAAAKALGEIKDLQAVEPLIKLLGDSYRRVRIAAAKALGEIKAPQAVGLLTKLLGDSDRGLRTAAAESLGEIKDPLAAEQLVKLLSDSYGDVRSAAAKALEKIGPPAVPALIKLLRDGGEDVRRSAVKVLSGTEGPLDVEPFSTPLRDSYDLLFAAEKVLVKIGPPAVPALIKALSDSNRDVRTIAAKTLGEIKDLRAAGPLIKLLGDSDWLVLCVAANALGEIKDPQAVEPLIKLLGDSNRHVRTAAAEALENIKNSNIARDEEAAKRDEDKNENQGQGGSPIFMSIIPFAFIFSGVAVVVVTLAIGAGIYLVIWRKFFPISWHLFWVKSGFDKEDAHGNALVKIGAPAVPDLIKVLGDRDSGVRRSAAKALSKIGPVTPEVVPALVKALKDDNSDVRRSAAKALGKIGPVKPEVISALIVVLTEGQTNFVSSNSAMEALIRIGAPAVPALIKALEDGDSDVRRSAAEALDKIGPVTPEVIPALIKVLGDSDLRVRQRAAYALLKINDAHLVSLRKYLTYLYGLVSKRSRSMILTDKDIEVIINSFREGRSINVTFIEPIIGYGPASDNNGIDRGLGEVEEAPGGITITPGPVLQKVSASMESLTGALKEPKPLPKQSNPNADAISQSEPINSQSIGSLPINFEEIDREWNDRVKRGGIFNYTLENVVRIKVGRLVKMLNIGRAGKRPPTATLDTMEPAFNPDPGVFNFLTTEESAGKRIKPLEILFPGGVNLGGVNTDIVVNTNPFYRGHVLFVPERLNKHNQVFIDKAAKVALAALRDINRSSYKVTFNSWQAWGSINHLHLQGFDYSDPDGLPSFPIERETPKLSFSTGNGVNVSTLLQPDWMVRTFVLSSNYKDREGLQDQVLKLTKVLYDLKQPFNILFTYNPADETYKVYVFSRAVQGPSKFGTGVAYLELSGEVLFINQNFGGVVLTSKDRASLIAQKDRLGEILSAIDSKQLYEWYETTDGENFKCYLRPSRSGKEIELKALDVNDPFMAYAPLTEQQITDIYGKIKDPKTVKEVYGQLVNPVYEKRSRKIYNKANKRYLKTEIAAVGVTENKFKEISDKFKEAAVSLPTQTATAGQASKTTQLFEIVESALSNNRAKFIDEGNTLIDSLTAKISPEAAAKIGALDKSMATAEIRQRIEGAIAAAEALDKENAAPEAKAAIESLRKSLSQFEADGAVGSLIVLARNAGRENQKLIIGLETDWITGTKDKSSLQWNAISALMKEINSIGQALKSMGLDNVEVIHGSGSELAGSLMNAAKETHTDMHNIVVMASKDTIDSDSFKVFRDAGEKDRPFLTGINPEELIKVYEEFRESISNQIHIKLVAFLYMTLEAATGKEPPKAPWIHYDSTARTLILVPRVPKAELKDYEALKRIYSAEKVALQAA